MQFKLPELGEGVHEGELVAWKVKTGDAVKFDQPLCEIMTDKATVEIPSAFQGKVAELHVKEGQVVHVGELMLSFEGAAAAGASASASSSAPAPQSSSTSGSAAHSSSSPAPTQASHQTSHHQASGSSAPSQSSAPSSSAPAPSPTSQAQINTDISTRVLAAPSTRRMAREMGVDLSHVQGSGPHGRVMKDDLQKSGVGATSAGSPISVLGKSRDSSAAREERVPFRGLRKKISEKMRISKDKAAHFTYVEEADATELVALRNQSKELAAKKGIKLTYLPFVMKAMVGALRQFPILNSTLDEERGELVFKHYYNIALSVQTDDGLTAPVVKDVGNKSVFQIAQDIQVLVEKARSKKLTMDDLTGGTITLTNAGSIGGLFATPIINYPEVAILGFNKIFRKPVVKKVHGEEKVVIRDWTYFSISLDHRIVDGAVGAEYMKLFIQYIENPNLLLLES